MDVSIRNKKRQTACVEAAFVVKKFTTGLGVLEVMGPVASPGFGARRGTCKSYWVLQEATVDI